MIIMPFDGTETSVCLLEHVCANLNKGSAITPVYINTSIDELSSHIVHIHRGMEILDIYRKKFEDIKICDLIVDPVRAFPYYNPVSAAVELNYYNKEAKYLSATINECSGKANIIAGLVRAARRFAFDSLTIVTALNKCETIEHNINARGFSVTDVPIFKQTINYLLRITGCHRQCSVVFPLFDSNLDELREAIPWDVKSLIEKTTGFDNFSVEGECITITKHVRTDIETKKIMTEISIDDYCLLEKAILNPTLITVDYLLKHENYFNNDMISIKHVLKNKPELVEQCNQKIASNIKEYVDSKVMLFSILEDSKTFKYALYSSLANFIRRTVGLEEYNAPHKEKEANQPDTRQESCDGLIKAILDPSSEK